MDATYAGLENELRKPYQPRTAPAPAPAASVCTDDHVTFFFLPRLAEALPAHPLAFHSRCHFPSNGTTLASSRLNLHCRKLADLPHHIGQPSRARKTAAPRSTCCLRLLANPRSGPSRLFGKDLLQIGPSGPLFTFTFKHRRASLTLVAYVLTVAHDTGFRTPLFIDYDAAWPVAGGTILEFVFPLFPPLAHFARRILVSYCPSPAYETPRLASSKAGISSIISLLFCFYVLCLSR